jgi:hypothetical protein
MCSRPLHRRAAAERGRQIDRVHDRVVVKIAEAVGFDERETGRKTLRSFHRTTAPFWKAITTRSSPAP